MHTSWIRQIAAVAIALFGVIDSASSQPADSWPSRPIKMIVAGGAGSGTDIIARLVGDRLTKALHQPIVIDNRAGASGILATDAVAKAPADGYTLLFSNASSTVMLQAFERKLPYDLVRDLVPIAQVGAGGVLLVVAADVPVKNLRELVAMVKSGPKKYVYATWGIGTSAHLLMEAIKHQSGMEIDHVPYKATPQIVQDLIGGQVQIAWLDISSSIPMIQAGRIRPIAISGTYRAKSSPEVATLVEQGYPLSADGWYGMFAPKGVRDDIIVRVNAEVNRIMALPEFRERMAQINIADAPQRTPEQFKTKIGEDMKTWRSIVLDNAIKPE
jgi:tripartite-type tricarboxylate transporter receptor subunit TctC